VWGGVRQVEGILDEATSAEPTLGRGNTIPISGSVSFSGELDIGERESWSAEACLLHE